MTVSSSNLSFILILVTNVLQGSLIPNGTVIVGCGSGQTFTCRVPRKHLGWNIAGLSGITIPGPFLARNASLNNPRIMSNDTGQHTQTGVSDITISGFSISDNGGIIQCVNMKSVNVRGMATISVVSLPLPPPTYVTATVESHDTVTLRWTQPHGPNDITTSVNCTPPSPGCAKCTTSPCTITGLNPSTEYGFTVTLNSGQCRTNMSTTTARTMDNLANASLVGASPASLAALAVLVLLIPLIYPLGVLIAKCCCFREKGYCEVFWCCGCCRKDKSPRCNSTELMKSPHPREEEEHQNENMGERVVISKTVEQQDEDGDVITDETVQQQGNQDGIQYAALDFSGHDKERNVLHSIEDPITYAAV